MYEIVALMSHTPSSEPQMGDAAGTSFSSNSTCSMGHSVRVKVKVSMPLEHACSHPIMTKPPCLNSTVPGDSACRPSPITTMLFGLEHTRTGSDVGDAHPNRNWLEL